MDNALPNLTDEQLLTLQSRMLEELATASSVNEALTALCLEIQQLVPRSVCTIMQLAPEGGTLMMLTSPHLSASMCAAFDGLHPGEMAASCGTAVFTGEPAIVNDTQTDPRWASYKDVAVEYGIGACWSIPIYSDGAVVGTFAISSPEPRTPTDYQMKVLETARHLAGIGISRLRADEHRRTIELKIQQTQRLESLGVLAGGIAHDFNNLLTGAIGNLDLAMAGLPPDSTARASLARVESATLRMAELSRQMLEYSGGDTFELVPIHPGDLIAEMAELLKASVSKNATMNVIIPTVDRPKILGEASRLRQVIMNLITNASDALEGEEGSIDLRLGTTVLERDSASSLVLRDTVTDGPFVWFEVQDSGIGMDDATRDRIFDPFFTTKHSGHGLGLAATLGIVRAHGGAIEIDTEVGRGTRIRVLIPVCRLEVDEEGVDSLDSVTAHGAGLVLVVEDEESVRSFAQSALERVGFDVITAPDGEAGLRLFESRADDINAVLLDFTMPVIDGVQVLRAIHRRKKVPVVLSSGHSRTKATGALSNQELAGYLQKPYRAHELSQLLVRVVSPGITREPTH